MLFLSACNLSIVLKCAKYYNCLLVFVLLTVDEAPQDEDSSDEAGPTVPTDATKQHITTPVMDSAEQFADDITDDADVVAAHNVVAETTNQHNNTCSEESEARRFPDPVAMETTCTSSSDGAVAGASKPDDGGSREHYLYQVKWIHYNGANVGVITQNENGPCPLLAIVNILTLQGKIKLPGTLEVVSSSQLMEYLADCIFEQAPPKVESDIIIYSVVLFVHPILKSEPKSMVSGW